MILKKNCVKDFDELIKNHFKHRLTSDQEALMNVLIKFMTTHTSRPLLIVTGYAGTGKSSFFGALIKSLKDLKLKACLLAPTGRASKVLSLFANLESSTIHRKIYFHTKKTDGSYKVNLAPNKHENTLFVIDESSMIPKNKLLHDIINYVYNGKNCQLIFIGDSGQLPPVGSSFSPALDKTYLKSQFNPLSIYHFHLNEIVRQHKNSGILYNATNIRNNHIFQSLKSTSFEDVIRVNGMDLQDNLQSSYDKVGEEETIIITRSNKRANNYNSHLRNRIFWREQTIEKGDLIMVIKNNYYWTEEDKNDFLANGEIFEVTKFIKEENIYNTTFLRVRIKASEKEREVLLFKDSFNIESAQLNPEFQNNLFIEVENDFAYMSNKKDRINAVTSNAYYNALQVKFAYAITCHKSQGGQWKHVYIDLGYITKDRMDKDFARWLYTAFSRSKEKLYLINFPEFLFRE